MTLADDVLGVVRLVPPGQVVSYGDLAELFATSPRIVGRIMATYEADDVPWWRVVRADGGLADHLVDRAVPHWRDEGIGTVNGRVHIGRHRADLVALADAAESLLGPLPGAGERVG
ncbi:MAG TPA: MGMT family protein [Propionibacteriaceae bacterium]|nr:MGMT family protein [Propionibacteriaceae bacterium]